MIFILLLRSISIVDLLTGIALMSDSNSKEELIVEEMFRRGKHNQQWGWQKHWPFKRWLERWDRARSGQTLINASEKKKNDKTLFLAFLSWFLSLIPVSEFSEIIVQARDWQCHLRLTGSVTIFIQYSFTTLKTWGQPPTLVNFVNENVWIENDLDLNFWSKYAGRFAVLWQDMDLSFCTKACNYNIWTIGGSFSVESIFKVVLK